MHYWPWAQAHIRPSPFPYFPRRIWPLSKNLRPCRRLESNNLPLSFTSDNVICSAEGSELRGGRGRRKHAGAAVALQQLALLAEWKWVVGPMSELYYLLVRCWRQKGRRTRGECGDCGGRRGRQPCPCAKSAAEGSDTVEESELMANKERLRRRTSQHRDFTEV